MTSFAVKWRPLSRDCAWITDPEVDLSYLFIIDIISGLPTTRPVCSALGDCVEGARYSERLEQLTGR